MELDMNILIFRVWIAVLVILLLVINIFIGIAYLSVYYPKAIKYLKNKVFEKNI
jgi:hypothetical protein